MNVFVFDLLPYDENLDHLKEGKELPGGAAAEVRERIIAAADHAGAGTVLVSLNRSTMPHEMFMEQVHRFGTEVLPALHAHRVRTVLHGS